MASMQRPATVNAKQEAASAGALRGIALFIGASVSFACMNTLAKFAAQGLHTVEVTWGRYFFSLLFVAVTLNALYHLSTRVLSNVDRPETAVVYTALFGAGVLSLLLPVVWTAPELWEFGELLILGALGFASQYLLVMAYARAPASTL